MIVYNYLDQPGKGMFHDLLQIQKGCYWSNKQVIMELWQEKIKQKKNNINSKFKYSITIHMWATLRLS